MIRALMRTTAALLCAVAFAVTAQAQTARPENNTAKVIPGQIVVDESTTVVRTMKRDPELAGLMDQAKAILIVPRYGANPSRLVNRAERDSPEGGTTRTADAMVRHGSPGVYLVHAAGWSAPAFFSIGNAEMNDMSNSSNSNSNSEQTDARGRPLVMMFMSSQAAHQLRGETHGSLMGLNVARYSDHPRGALSGADVVLWTPHQRMHAKDLNAAQVHYDATASNAYYRNQATLGDILSSSVSTPRASELQGALSMRVASSK